MLKFTYTAEKNIKRRYGSFHTKQPRIFLVLIYLKKMSPSLKRLSCSQNQSLTLPWTILLILDIPHMQNHLLKVTREVEKLEFHGLQIGIYTDFIALLLKKGKCFLQLRNHSNRWAYLLYFYF